MADRLFRRAKPIGRMVQLEFALEGGQPLSVTVPSENARVLVAEVINALRAIEGPGDYVKSFGAMFARVELYRASISNDGQIACLRVARANGEVTEFPFFAHKTVLILHAVERALGQIFERQREKIGGHDPRTFFQIGARRIPTVQGGVATDGTPLVSLVSDKGVRSDFALAASAISGLIDLLRNLEALAKKPVSAPH